MTGKKGTKQWMNKRKIKRKKLGLKRKAAKV